MKNNFIIRQGEVMLIRINEFPKKLKEKDKILAYGEITNHKHRFETNQVQVFADESGQQFVQVKKPSQLIHEEHQALEIPKGNYKVVLQREFDMVENFAKQVLD